MVLHALTDALLGAIGDGDIGSHFPPSEARWKGAASSIFLRHAVDLVGARGGTIANLNATVVCEMPKVGPHRDAMRARIAEIAGVAVDRVGITATTSERMGFTGRGEGIVAWGSGDDPPPARARLSVLSMFSDALMARATALVAACRARSIVLATAESCTGGLIAALITEVPGSSAAFDRGFVTYSNDAKSDLLGIPASLISAARRRLVRRRGRHGGGRARSVQGQPLQSR